MSIYKNLFEGNDVGEVLYNEPMKNHTTFKIGGNCDVMVIPRTEAQIINTYKIIKDNNLDYRVIGNGSNLLVSDKGLREVIIKLHDNFNNVVINNDELIAESGALLSVVSKLAMKHSYEGFEQLSGIPGDIGGAITMNAGAYGKEIKELVKSVKIIDSDLNIKYMSNEQMEFGYRSSIIQKEKFIVLSATFKLEKGNYDEIMERFRDFTHRRTSKQPLELPSCGSVFKRPEGHYAGQLIDNAGLRGYRYNDAMVSEKHCGFIVNVGEATCDDVIRVIDHVREVVYEKFEVDLEPEVRIIGEK